MSKRNLGVIVDGERLPEDQATAVWERFSAFMEEHRGDLAGFAAQEGWKSVHPAVENGQPVLLASHSAAQRPYTAVRAAEEPAGGSGVRRDPSVSARPRRKTPRK